MPPAVAAAGITAAATIGGSVLGSKATSKAANKAADTSLAVADKNNALARDIYGQNQQILSPYVARGNVAGDAINSILGLPAAPAPVQQQAMPQMSPAHALGGSGMYWKGLPISVGQHLNGNPGPMQGFGTPGIGSGVPQAAAAPGPAVNGNDAFRNYIANSDYAFTLGEGTNALNHGYAAGGTLQSGAAMKALEQYRQNLQRGYRGEYLGLLSNQQGVGLSGASAIAGVGQNYVNNVSANNNSAGSAAANAQLYGGVAKNNMFADIGSALGTFASSFRR